MRDIELSEVRRCVEWYNTLSNSYDELYGEEQRVKYGRIFRYMCKDLGIFLDLGCGTGTLLEYLVESGFKVMYYVCVDISDKAVGLASKKSKIFNKDGMVDFIVADIAYPPLREKPTFDTVAMITVLKEDYNIVKIIRKYVSRVRRNGFLLYTVIRKRLRNNGLRYEDAYIANTSGYVLNISLSSEHS